MCPREMRIWSEVQQRHWKMWRRYTLAVIMQKYHTLVHFYAYLLVHVYYSKAENIWHTEQQDKCAHVHCGSGQKCNKDTGKCMDGILKLISRRHLYLKFIWTLLCLFIYCTYSNTESTLHAEQKDKCEHVKCGYGQKCDKDTGKCGK